MKNKTLRTNSMKLKKVIAASLAISVLFAFTGCGSSSSTNNTNTKQESSSTTETGSADELNEKLNDLYQQENQLFADHKDAWDKAFGLMNKNAAGDAMSENYADSLASTVESNKDSCRSLSHCRIICLSIRITQDRRHGTRKKFRRCFFPVTTKRSKHGAMRPLWCGQPSGGRTFWKMHSRFPAHAMKKRNRLPGRTIFWQV